ncbi:Fe-S cluster assembly protein SufD [Rathayibacter soli]|uniref:Fe-S cluster assembly protein SufD n=1 Tax=Rathayibacter soli TaxID=3144168 RepID=UPI0027E540C7|nr:Fe-S cluster assembly protein SufD [Glaciibacter superstes]
MSSAATQTVSTEPQKTEHGLTHHKDGEYTLLPVESRAARFRSTNVNDFPTVTGRELIWKRTPIAQIGDLIAGDLNGSVYDIRYEPVDGLTVDWVNPDDPRIGSTGLPEDRASANAWGSFQKALSIVVSGDKPATVTVTRSAFGNEPRAAHTIIEAAPFSTGTVILRNLGVARLAENVEIIVGESARLTVVSVQEWDDVSVHAASHFATVGRDAFFKHVVVSLGGAVVRLNPTTHLAGTGAEVEMLGVYFADAGQHLEQQVYVYHEAAHGRSRVNYKGALQGHGAHTVWIGDVLIGADAAGTDSYEQNRNLVLTDGTRADSEPNLEIETGDILGAGHASATGRFDDEQLFYLESRGITEEEARRLVVRGFLIEVIQRINVPELEERLQHAIEAELAGERFDAADLPAADRSAAEVPAAEVSA